ncbi:Serine/threonine-protein kinase 19, partial [Spiromyces aspiralis]
MKPSPHRTRSQSDHRFNPYEGPSLRYQSLALQRRSQSDEFPLPILAAVSPLPAEGNEGHDSIRASYNADDRIVQSVDHLIEVLFRPTDRARFRLSKAPSLCFLHQLYSASGASSTMVDKEVNRLCGKGVLRKFKITGSGGSEFVIIRIRDLRAIIKDARSKFESGGDASESSGSAIDVLERFEQFLTNGEYCDVSVSRDKLIAELKTDDSHLNILFNLGFLVTEAADKLTFSLPWMGLFITQIVKGRKEIASRIKRKAAKEMLQK